MKKNALSLLVTGALFLIPATQAGCDQRSSDLSFTREGYRYVIDAQSGKVSISRQDGTLVEMYSTPAAGPGREAVSDQPAIIHYLLLGKGSISGLAWNDLNGNRKADAGEQGVEGVRVYIDTDNSKTYSQGDAAELTDTNGFYTFPTVKPGINNIFIDTDTLPSGYGFTTNHPLTVNLVRNQIAKDANFGVQEQARTSNIDGAIWDKTDSSPIAGVRVYVDLNNDDEFSSDEPYSTTDTSGNYVISAIPDGTFNVRADNGTLDAQYHRTPVQGTNPTLINFVSRSSQTVSLSYIHKATICGTLRDAGGRQLGNVFLFVDLNHNEAYDNGEPMTFTNDTGGYCFNELMPGEYALRLVSQQWDGYTITSPAILTVGAGGDIVDVDFFLKANPITITGQVWDDANGSGKLDTEEKGLADVRVFLDVNNNNSMDAGEVEAITSDLGAFMFTGLEEGNYYIRVADSALQKAYMPTTPNPVFTYMKTGQTYDEARFGYQSKLAPINTLQYPIRLTWGGDNNLYISDYKIGSVFIYDSALNLKGELKGLAKPLGVTTDSAGNIYVGNEGRKNVEVYDSAGNLLRTIGNGNILKPNDLAVDRFNNLYILDSANDAVLVYDPNGNPLYAIVDSTILDYAVSIAIAYRDDGSGNEIGELYIADQPKCTIHVFSLGGFYKKSVGTSGNQMTKIWDGKFSGLMAVDIDQYGNIHGLDNSLNVVQVFEPQGGTFLRSYNAYPVENANRLNLQMDLGINPADSRVVMANIATKTVETVTTVTGP